MGRLFLVALLSSLWSAAAVAAEGEYPKVFPPDALHWVSPPWDVRVQAAWVIGSDQAPRPYLLRVRIAPGGKIPPHTHPDERYTTVLSGTLHVSFGLDFDPSRSLVLPAGSVYVSPALQPHSVWAEETEVTYQEAGNGPTATTFLNR